MKVAIAGYGVEGEANYKYWIKKTKDITIFDEAERPLRDLPKAVESRLGKGCFSDMNGFDLVIRTASLDPTSIQTDGEIWSATNEFFAECPAPIIGVTGTKGKGTTCTLIADILKAAGSNVHLVGNIGTPALDVLPSIKPDDIVVFELSSFQLWDIKKSPTTAVILMIEPDHLNVHHDMDDYVAAKANIGRYQDEEDLLIYHPTNKLSAKAASVSIAQKKRYMTAEGAQVGDDSQLQKATIYIDDDIICDVSEVGLIGAHNLENICAAITAAWRYTQDIDAIATTVKSFKGLEHRLEFVREVGGVKYYNDSFSTGPAAAMAALQSFNEKLLVIVGGSDKDVDMNQLLDYFDSKKHSLVLIGTAADSLEKQLKDRSFGNYTNLGALRTMHEIMQHVYEMIIDERVVLLSPAHASFDMFKNVYDRGTQFKSEVSQLS